MSTLTRIQCLLTQAEGKLAGADLEPTPEEAESRRADAMSLRKVAHGLAVQFRPGVLHEQRYAVLVGVTPRGLLRIVVAGPDGFTAEVAADKVEEAP